MKRLLRVALSMVAATGQVLAVAETRVTVSPADQVMAVGETPQFTVRIEAIGSPARVIRFVARDDLRVNYARLTVSQQGKPVELISAISDPGPIGDADIVTLHPSMSITFVHRGEPYSLRELPPGTYAARVVLDSTLVGGDRVDSNIVTFQVKAK